MQDTQRIHFIPKLFGIVTAFWFSACVEFSTARLAPAIIEHCNHYVHITRFGSRKQQSKQCKTTTIISIVFI